MYDLVVVGAGAGGLAAAGRAADRGARVLVLEKADAVGGSAAMSAGILWTAPDEATLRAVQPRGDHELGALLVSGFQQTVADVAATGAGVSDQWREHLEFGVACKIDVHALFAAWVANVRAAGGEVLTGVRDVRLLRDGGAVVGAAFVHSGEEREASAPAVVLATGGFAGDAQMRAEYIGHGADDIVVRANPCSVGDGFRLGQSAGAAASTHMSAFYGHLLPSPLDVRPEHFLPLATYFSAYGILVNRAGRRFTDESLGDEVSNQRVIREVDQRAVLLWDAEVNAERVSAVPYPHGMAVDRFAAARDVGARALRAETLDDLLPGVSAWGVDAVHLAGTLDGYARAARGEAVGLDAPLPARPYPLASAPFYAIEVQPSITMTFGGLRADRDGRVLDRDGRPVPGLYGAGADVGGVQDLRYIGGLIVGLVFGRRAADAALNRRERR